MISRYNTESYKQAVISIRRENLPNVASFCYTIYAGSSRMQFLRNNAFSQLNTAFWPLLDISPVQTSPLLAASTTKVFYPQPVLLFTSTTFLLFTFLSQFSSSSQHFYNMYLSSENIFITGHPFTKADIFFSKVCTSFH